MEIKIKNLSKHKSPSYAKDGDSGLDLYANLDSEIVLKPLQRVLIPTDIYVEIPKGYEGQVRPRSGLALKYGITVFE
jgi:dUTP pyrophosphatase